MKPHPLVERGGIWPVCYLENLGPPLICEKDKSRYWMPKPQWAVRWGGGSIRVCSVFVSLVYYEPPGAKHLPFISHGASQPMRDALRDQDGLSISWASGSEGLYRFVKSYHFLLHFGVRAFSNRPRSRGGADPHIRAPHEASSIRLPSFHQAAHALQPQPFNSGLPCHLILARTGK